MLLYNLRLAALSLRSTPWTSLICVLTIGLGVGVATAMTGIHHMLSGNPLPSKSDVLFNVRIDTWDANTEFFDVAPGEPPKAVTYRDMTGLMESDIPRHQTGVANARAYVFPDGDGLEPYQTTVRLCHASFFPMFEIPLRYGSSWTLEMEQDQEAVVVLSQKANDKLFGGRDSVGEMIRLSTRQFKVVGVLDQYAPMPMFYDPVNNMVGEVREFFLPFDFIRDQELGFSITGNTDGWGDGATFQGDLRFTTAEYYWIQLWVEVEAERQAEYVAFVRAYSEGQKDLGRHPRPINDRVSPMMTWVSDRNRPTAIASVVRIIALLFLSVCSINLVGLLLGKFLARSDRIGVRRALGASRFSVFAQHVVEVELVGAIGGGVGILFALLSLDLIKRTLPQIPGTQVDRILTLDGYMVFVAVVLALLSGLIAGVYPAWRACRVAPAMQIKVL